MGTRCSSDMANAVPGTVPRLSQRPRAFLKATNNADEEPGWESPKFTPIQSASPGGKEKKKKKEKLERMRTAEPGPLGTDEYEFNEKQEQVFHNLIGIIYSCAVMFFLMFLVTMVQIIYESSQDKGKPPDVPAASDAIDWLFYAYFLRRASLAFELVVTSEGSDIQNLMDGLNKLYLLFKRMRFVSTIYVIKTIALTAITHPSIA